MYDNAMSDEISVRSFYRILRYGGPEPPRGAASYLTQVLFCTRLCMLPTWRKPTPSQLP